MSKIVAFLLNADSRVVDKSSGALVLSMVSGWVDLKEDIFTELSELIENKETPLRRLGNIQAQIETPHSALSQFFNLGHGEHFWQAASPWPSRFASLLEFIKDNIASNNSCMVLSSSGEDFFGNEAFNNVEQQYSESPCKVLSLTVPNQPCSISGKPHSRHRFGRGAYASHSNS